MAKKVSDSSWDEDDAEANMNVNAGCIKRWSNKNVFLLEKKCPYAFSFQFIQFSFFDLPWTFRYLCNALFKTLP